MPTELRLALFDAPPLERRFAAAGPSSNSPGRPIDLKELLATIDGVDPASCRRVVVSAARPRMHPGLEPLLDRCRERGLGGVTLECEGAALAPDGEVEWFSQRGVVRVDVVLGGIRRKVHEAVMRDVSGWLPAMRGVRAAAEGATELSVRLPLLQWSAEDAVPLLEWLLALPGRLHGFFLAPPRVDEVPAHARAVLLSQPEQARIAARVFDICRRHGLDYGFSSPHAISPCASRELDAFGTVFHQRIRHYQHEPTADLVAIAACSECSLHPSCRGIERAYVERFGERELAAVPLDASMGWRLQRTSRLDEHDYKNVSAFENDHEGLGRSLVRVNGHCQMACAFCFVDRTAPDFDTDALEREITTLAQHQTDHLVLSGGEPTLHPDLPRLIEHARTLQFRTIEIQTNGVRSADLEYARSLAAAGLGKATASLHSADPERSDAITKMRGAFPKTLRALHHFRALGLRTQIAHVVTKENYRELPAFVRFVREEFPEEGGHLSLCLAIAQGISDLVYSWAIPTFTEIKPYFREALDYCLETRLGFGGMIGQGGYPPCMLDGELAYYAANFQNVYRSADHDAQFYKAPRCVDCSFDPYCIGVRRDYIACYGDAELRPFRAPPGALEGTRPIGPSAPEPPHAGQMPRELVRLRRKSA